MDMVGQRINHIVYGDGTIIKRDGLKVTIKFDNEEETRIIGLHFFKDYVKFYDDSFNTTLIKEENDQLLKAERERKENARKEQLRRKLAQLNKEKREREKEKQREARLRDEALKKEELRKERLSGKAKKKHHEVNEIIYQKQLYYRLRSGWVDSHFSMLPAYKQIIIEEEYRRVHGHQSTPPILVNDDHSLDVLKAVNFKLVNRSQLLDIADEFKSKRYYKAAVVCYKKLILRQDYEECKYIYPKLLSCFRSLEEPEKVFQLLEYIEKTHGKDAVTKPLLTSASAAFCDMLLPTKAVEYAHLAYELPDCGDPEYLENVIGRITYLFESCYYDMYPEFHMVKYNYENNCYTEYDTYIGEKWHN